MAQQRPLWYDEIATTIMVTDPSLSHMLRAMLAGVESAPPLYHLIARTWVGLFGASELALRLLSSIGMATALWLVWAALQRTFSLPAAAIGVLTVFGTSELILRQNHEVRFYGLWMAFCALSVYFCVRMVEVRRPSRRILAGAVLAHAAVVLTHTLGVLYVGALLLAAIAADLLARRMRPMVYGTYLAGLLAFLPWVVPTMRQATVGAERSWITLPGIGAFLPAYQFGMAALPLVILAVVMLNRWAPVARPADPAAVAPAGLPPNAALLIAGALFLVPVLLFATSHLVRPLFLDRYMLPSIIGWALVLSVLVDGLAPTRNTAGSLPHPTRSDRFLERLQTSGMYALIAGLAIYPVLMAVTTPATPLPGAALESFRAEYGDAGGEVTTVVVESGLSFLALRHYDSAPDEEYVYPTDWELAMDPASPNSAAAFDQYMRLLREHYDIPGVVDGEQVLCDTRRFVVLDGPWLWFERRVAGDPAYAHRAIGRFEDEVVIRIVERVEGETPRGCAVPAT